MKDSPGAPFPEPFFLPLPRGQRFCIRYWPASGPRGAMLFVPAFAEEMNKSRRMVALQARALADGGWAVLVPDLYGCGDSEGDLADADWTTWRDDVLAAAAWLHEQTGHRPALWAMRTGCLLACDAARCMDAATDLVFWQPHFSGRQALQQFLRLRVAQQAMADSSVKRATTADLREELRRGETLEVAGYALPPGIALPLDDTELAPPPRGSRAVWFEVIPWDDGQASRDALARVEAWRASSIDMTLHAISGAGFWQTQEIAECPELIDATRAAVAGWLR